MKDKVLYAALSAIANNTILPYNNCSGNNKFIPRNGYSGNNLLDEISFHQSHLVGGKVPTNNINNNDGQSRIPWSENSKVLIGTDYNSNRKKFERAKFFRRNYVFVKTLTGKTITVDVDLNETIDQLKTKIYIIEGIPPNQQKLIFTGKIVGDSTLRECNVQCGSTLYVLRVNSYSSSSNALFIHPNKLAPLYDYDFKHTNDKGITFMRGNYEYKRPYGWRRFALNVLNKYDDNTWLGVDKRKNSSSSVRGEWPVSYHGTAKDNCKSIAEDGYLLCKGKRFLFGNGIYSTPDIDVAYRYATKFTLDGDEYRVVFQNRVNPNTLIKISKEETGIGEYWISPDGADLRPYGICIKKEFC